MSSGTNALVALLCLGASWLAVAPPALGGVDLLPDLNDGDVCTTEEQCWPRRASIALHRDDPDQPHTVRLPTGSWTSAYVRIAGKTARLALDYAAVGTELVLQARADGDPDVVLHRGAATGGAWRHVVFDLAPWRGRIVHLRLRPDATPGAMDHRCAVRRIELEEVEPSLRPPSPGNHPNLILYVVDTLRADRLGCYGYTRPTSPNVDAFARSALLFKDAVAQSSWTLAATASLLTGRIPPSHGAVDVGTALLPDVVTLPERLRAAGYRTAAFVTNSLVSRSYGLDRGFAEFHQYPEKPLERAATYLPARILHRRIHRWLNRHATGAPFFLYVHSTDPHWPYLPAPRHARLFRRAGRTRADEEAAVRAARPYFFGNEHQGERPTTMARDRVALLSDLYDGDVRAADEAFGSLVDDLARLGLFERTVVVFTSDHGEEFLEHDGLGHGQTLHQEVVHVPLLVRLPGGARGGERVTRPVQQVDVAPTILEFAGVASASDLEGQSLVEEPNRDAEIVSHLDYLGVRFDSITTEHWKAVRDLGAVAAFAPVAVYDRDVDGAERHDLSAERPAVVGYARQQLRRAVVGFRPGPEVDTAVLARLRALGYVNE